MCRKRVRGASSRAHRVYETAPARADRRSGRARAAVPADHSQVLSDRIGDRRYLQFTSRVAVDVEVDVSSGMRNASTGHATTARITGRSRDSPARGTQFAVLHHVAGFLTYALPCNMAIGHCPHASLYGGEELAHVQLPISGTCHGTRWLDAADAQG